MNRLFQSLLQSDFGAHHKNFEAVVQDGNDLWHWWRDNSVPGFPWRRGQRIVQGRVAFPASMIQRQSSGGAHGRFEVVVPLLDDRGAVSLWHLWNDTEDPTKPWSSGERITEEGRRVTGPASIVGVHRSGEQARFDVIVPIAIVNETIELWHYSRTADRLDDAWLPSQRINSQSHQVLGSGCVIDTGNRQDSAPRLEACAWVKLPDGRSVLQHYWQNAVGSKEPWNIGPVIAEGVTGNGVMIQSRVRERGQRLDLVVPIEGAKGRTYIQHLWRNGNDVESRWQQGQVISEVASTNGSAVIIQSSFGGEDNGNLEVLLDECSQSLVAYWHPIDDDNVPWLRHIVVLGESANREIRDTARICQLSGEFDRTDWNGDGQPPFAFNRTESRFGIRGTDLGASFEHDDQLVFLFGDTWRVGETLEQHKDDDAIAFSRDDKIEGGISLTFQSRAPQVKGVSQAAFEVPTDGFSYQGLMFVFFTTDHRRVGNMDLMGRSLLAVSNDNGLEFSPILNFSVQKFINVSVERASLEPMQASAVGWPTGTEVLWVWASGRYRASPAYLAVIDLAKLVNALLPVRVAGPLELSAVNSETGTVLYFTGLDNDVCWSSNELDAVPLFAAGDIGEVSCRHNAPLNRYLITYNSGNPRGITLRHSPQPWGPWSPGYTIFDPGWGAGPNQPVGAGYGKFMHIPWQVAQVDHVHDSMFQQGPRTNEWGGEYGPYQIPRFSTADSNNVTSLYYTMSTWNPYQSVLMRTRIRPSDLVAT